MEELTHEKRFFNSFRAIIYNAALLFIAFSFPLVTNISDQFRFSTHKLHTNWFLGWQRRRSLHQVFLVILKHWLALLLAVHRQLNR